MKLQRATRKERINRKIARGVYTLPFSLTTISLNHDDNLGFIIRAAGCFGATEVNVIGAMPNETRLRKASVHLVDYIPLRQFKSVEEFTASLDDQTDIVCIELTQDSLPISEWKPDPTRHTNIIVGNETNGIPGPLTIKFPCFYIPMPGVGTCLNTAQAANIAAYHYIHHEM